MYNCVIFRIDEYNAKEVKESIFLVDARESQKALIALAHCNQTCGTQQAATPGPISTEKVLSSTHLFEEILAPAIVCICTFADMKFFNCKRVMGDILIQFSVQQFAYRNTT